MAAGVDSVTFSSVIAAGTCSDFLKRKYTGEVAFIFRDDPFAVLVKTFHRRSEVFIG